jgi:hypothetical protein
MRRWPTLLLVYGAGLRRLTAILPMSVRSKKTIASISGRIGACISRIDNWLSISYTLTIAAKNYLANWAKGAVITSADFAPRLRHASEQG